MITELQKKLLDLVITETRKNYLTTYLTAYELRHDRKFCNIKTETRENDL